MSVAEGDAVYEGDLLAVFDGAAADGDEEAQIAELEDLNVVRDDVAEIIRRHKIVTDDSERPESVARRRKTNSRTARENVADMCDEGTFAEYGPLVIAGQRQRRSLDDLIKNTPADGLVCGFGEVNTHRTAICCYDYTVLAGTQGNNQHHKHDKIFQICKTQRVPIVFYTEGGGGRPGDTDGGIGPGLKLHVQQQCFLDLSRFPSC